MSDLITLSKNDPKFFSYMDGTFSEDYRALPMKSLNVNRLGEQVTFQILPKASIQVPKWGLHWLRILKVKNLLMVFFPIFTVWTRNVQMNLPMDLVTGALASLGTVFLMIAANLRNDYLDHLSGLDRLHPHTGSHAIQKGWVTASQVNFWFYIYSFVGVLFGLRTLIQYPQSLNLIAVVALVGIAGMKTYQMGLKFRRWSEATVFLLLGPCLAVGIHFSMGGTFDWTTFFLGCLSGWLSLFYLNLKNFEHLMVNDQAQFQNTITWLGFEKSKTWLTICWGILMAGLLWFSWSTHPVLAFVPMALASSLFTWVFLFRLWRLQSPLGSQITFLVRRTQAGLLALMSLWSLQALVFGLGN